MFISAIYQIHCPLVKAACTNLRDAEMFVAVGNAAIVFKKKTPTPKTNSKQNLLQASHYLCRWMAECGLESLLVLFTGLSYQNKVLRSITLGVGKLQLLFYLLAEIRKLRMVLQACSYCFLTQGFCLSSGYEISSLYLQRVCVVSFRTWFKRVSSRWCNGLFFQLQKCLDLEGSFGLKLNEVILYALKLTFFKKLDFRNKNIQVLYFFC